MVMSREKLERERRQKTLDALQLLIVSGAVRPADVYIRYHGPGILPGTGLSDIDVLWSEAVGDHRSMWTTIVDNLSPRISPTSGRVEASPCPQAARLAGAESRHFREPLGDRAESSPGHTHSAPVVHRAPRHSLVNLLLAYGFL